MKLPLTLEASNKWPFDLLVRDADGTAVIIEPLYAHSTKDRSFEEALSCINHCPENRAEAAAMNAEQLERLKAIVLAVNSHDDLLEALRSALAWIDSVPAGTALPAMPGFDRDDVNVLIAKAGEA